MSLAVTQARHRFSCIYVHSSVNDTEHTLPRNWICGWSTVSALWLPCMTFLSLQRAIDQANWWGYHSYVANRANVNVSLYLRLDKSRWSNTVTIKCYQEIRNITAAGLVPQPCNRRIQLTSCYEPLALGSWRFWCSGACCNAAGTGLLVSAPAGLGSAATLSCLLRPLPVLRICEVEACIIAISA